MYVRLGFSVAINVDPDILLVDEVLAVGDAEFQRKCTEKFAEFRSQRQDDRDRLPRACPRCARMCDEVALLEHGKLIDIGPPGEVIDGYLAETFTTTAERGRAVRWGSGEVRIERVEMLDESGVPITHAAHR